MTPKEMIIFHIGVYYGKNLGRKEISGKIIDLSKYLMFPTEDLLKLFDDIMDSMRGMIILEPITGLKY